MVHSQPDAKWPYVAVAVGLFGLTLLAPRIWRPTGRKDPPRAVVAPTEERAGPLTVAPKPPEPIEIEPIEIEPGLAVAKRVVSRPTGAPMAPEPVAADAFMEESDGAPGPIEPAPVWPRAVALREAVARLQEDAVTHDWAERILRGLSVLEEGDDLPPERFAQATSDLDAAMKHAEALHERLVMRHDDLGSAVLRVQYALERRLDIWRAAYELARGDLEGAAEDDEAEEMPSVREILEQVEEYEVSRPASLGQGIVAARRELAKSTLPEARRLGEHLESHYRNANVRLSVSGVLLNRLLPQQKPTESEVDDVVAGAAVRGRRWTDMKVRVRLLPDDRLIRLGLEAYGEVVSRTHSTTGPATLFSAGQSQFLARKLILIDGLTMRQFPAVASADTETMLSGIRTDFDSVPLLGSLVQSIARSEYGERRGEARREVEWRVSQQASAELQRQAAPKLERLAQGWREHIVKPLDRFNLRPRVMSQATDERRVAVRFRLAGDDQLGGHTARPRAPGDSLLSLQIHESAINNAIESFALDGRTFELRSLYDSLAERLGRPDLKAPDDVPEEVHVTFAEEDCLRVRLDEGKAQVRLRIKELTADEKRWRNLVIHAEYHPATSGLDAQLARIEAVQVAGDRLSIKSQVTLKAIFSRMFTRNRQVQLLPEQIGRDTRLTDLHISQLEIEDGWLGLAVGAKRVAARPDIEKSQRPLR